jgi:hypothetical protein
VLHDPYISSPYILYIFVPFISYEALHYTIYSLFLPLRNKLPPQHPVCGKVSHSYKTPDNMTKECLKKTEVCGATH